MTRQTCRRRRGSSSSSRRRGSSSSSRRRGSSSSSRRRGSLSSSHRRQSSVRGSSRRRGTGGYTIEQEQKEIDADNADGLQKCQNQCVNGTDVFAKAKYTGCMEACKGTPYTKQSFCESQIERCNSITEDGRKCYPEKVNNFLFYPDKTIVEESRLAIPQLYQKRFGHPLAGCEDLMTQYETYLAKNRTGPYRLFELFDCQMKQFIEQELAERPNENIDKTLKSIMCRKSNYSI